jgi:hypothetical protein
MMKNQQMIPIAMGEIRREIALVVERGAKEELWSGHGLIKGDLKRSITVNPGHNKTIIAPHVIYSGWIEFGGLHPRWKVPTSFGGYHYMQTGGQKGAKQAQMIGEKVMEKYFGD